MNYKKNKRSYKRPLVTMKILNSAEWKIRLSWEKTKFDLWTAISEKSQLSNFSGFEIKLRQKLKLFCEIGARYRSYELKVIPDMGFPCVKWEIFLPYVSLCTVQKSELNFLYNSTVLTCASFLHWSTFWVWYVILRI